MENASKNVFVKARAAYLPAIIRSAGVELRAQGASFGSCFCPKCGKSDNPHSNKVSVFMSETGVWRWSCFACGVPGASAIDYVASLYDVTDREAADKILGAPPEIVQQKHSAPSAVRTAEAEAAMTDALGRIFKSAGTEVGAKFLAGRGISQKVIQEAAARRVFKSMHSIPADAQRFLSAVVGKDLLEKSGLKKSHSHWSAIAFRPVIFPLGRDGAEFRLSHKAKQGELKSIRYGRLSLPSYWKAADSNDVMIVEGAIDMLSVVSMGWKGSVMGIPGVSSYKMEWFAEIKKRNPSVNFHIGLDPDKAGFEASNKIADLLENAGMKSRILNQGESGTTQDWNDRLLAGERL